MPDIERFYISDTTASTSLPAKPHLSECMKFIERFYISDTTASTSLPADLTAAAVAGRAEDGTETAAVAADGRVAGAAGRVQEVAVQVPLAVVELL